HRAPPPTLTRRRFVEAEWAAALDDVARASGPDVAAHTLDRLLARQRVRDGARARLLLADGNRRLAGGELEAAQRRYAQAERAAPDSVEGQRARLLLVRVLVLDASGDAALFRAAELGRDSRGSARLAGRLVVRMVQLAP